MMSVVEIYESLVGSDCYSILKRVWRKLILLLLHKPNIIILLKVSD